jgi:hypothetical protein
MRIAFISDVAPLPTHAGELVLHNHLVRMPDSEILIITPPPRVTPAVTNAQWETAILPGWLTPLVRRPTRLIFQALAALYVDRRYREIVKQFRPDIVLTVWHSCFFFGAYRISRKLKLPLALICHDDHEMCILPQLPLFRPVARGWLGRIYRDAAARFCVCPSMERIFAQRYGARGTVLYPLASSGLSEISGRDLMSEPAHPLRIGYAGTVADGNFRVLDAILGYLDSHDGTFCFAAPSYQMQRDRITKHRCVVDLGHLSPESVCELLPARVDAMLVIQSFDPAESICIQTAFPSKLVQYTQFKLPLLIVGPSSASAVQWAQTHPGAAVVVHSQNEDEISRALDILSGSNRRGEIAEKLREIAAGEFATEEIQKVFIETLERCRSDQRKQIVC